ncbi:MAG: plasmid pRiA4b ORF-3 family protein [Phycisphaeraceae bacterium]
MSRDIYQIRVDLRDTKPPIWRRLLVPGEITLGQLHEIIQIAMDWTNSHLHQFRLKDKALKDLTALGRLAEEERWDELRTAASGERLFAPREDPFGDPLDLDGEDEDAVTLAELHPQGRRKLIYEYDFGDGWEHLIKVEKVLAPDDLKPGVEPPACLTGRLAAPPEDCGGVWGYYELLDALDDPDHPEHDDLRGWMGLEEEEDLDPDTFDLEEINAELARWRAL